MGKNNPLDRMFGAFGPTFTVLGTLAMMVALIVWATTILPTDFETTRIGYMASPTVKINQESVATAVSVLIFSLQIIGMFGLLRSTNSKRSRIFGAVAIGSLLYDMYTDMVAKFPSDLVGNGFLFIALNRTDLFIAAFLETLLIFTFMSEILASLLVEEIISVFPDFIRGLGTVASQVYTPIANSLSNIFVDDDNSYKNSYQQNRSMGNSDGQRRNSGQQGNGRKDQQRMNRCKVCGVPIQDGTLCRKHQLEQMYKGSGKKTGSDAQLCPSCGIPLRYGTNVCPSCHVELIWEED